MRWSLLLPLSPITRLLVRSFRANWFGLFPNLFTYEVAWLFMTSSVLGSFRSCLMFKLRFYARLATAPHEFCWGETLRRCHISGLRSQAMLFAFVLRRRVTSVTWGWNLSLLSRVTPRYLWAFNCVRSSPCRNTPADVMYRRKYLWPWLGTSRSLGSVSDMMSLSWHHVVRIQAMQCWT